MCDLISGYIEVESGAILSAHPASHSGTAQALGLKLDQRERYSEWEWPAGAEAPKVRHTDAAMARRLVSSIMARFSTRADLVEHCRPQWERAGHYLVESQADADRVPAEVPGDVICTLTSALLPQLRSIGGYASFSALTDAAGLSALTSIGGDADFSALTDAAGLSALTSIGGYASFSALTDAAGLSALTSIGGSADFRALTDAQRVMIPALNREAVKG